MSAVETIWQELLTAALLGTERRPPAAPTVAGALGDVLAGLDPASPQRFLLRAAGVVALYRQAGRLPVRLAGAEIPACAADAAPRCGPAAAARLASLLGGTYRELLPEWLALAAAAQKRVPEELLPEVLAWGESHLEQVDRVLPVLGQRGRWLAGQLPGAENLGAAVFAETIAPEAAQTAWETGHKAARRFLLRRLRKTAPALALSLVAATWTEENAEERRVFLEILEDGLSMAEEPFLEEALDDRSKEVRRVAADLLARLSGSRLVKRQAERAAALLKWKPGGFLRKAQIEVTLPEACDKGMLRDGVLPKAPLTKKLGEKGEWLLQILQAIPPATWSRGWGKSPAELLEIAGDGDWQELLHEGWSTATLRHQDLDWAEAILKIYPGRSQLLAALPEKRRLAFLAAQIQARAREGVELAVGYRGPWGSELTRLALPRLRKVFTGDNDPPRLPFLRASVLALGPWLDPALSREAAKIWLEKAEPDSAWEQAVEGLLQMLDFRHQMMEELK